MAKTVAVIISTTEGCEHTDRKKRQALQDVGGRAAFLRSVELFTDRDDVKQVLLAISPHDAEIFDIRWSPNLSFFGVKVYHAGNDHWQTVRSGLALLNDDIDMVAIHDAARCCVTEKLVEAVFQRAANTGAAIAGNPLQSVLKQVDSQLAGTTVPYRGLYEAQSPQVFDRPLLVRAYEKLDSLNVRELGDDAQLVETLGEAVTVVPSDHTNMRLRSGSDISLAEAIIKSRPKPKPSGPTGPYNEAQW